MFAGRIIVVFLSYIFVIFVAGCATTTAPGGWLPHPSEAQSEVFGGWMSIRYRDGSRTLNAHGELIAVQEEKVFLLTRSGLTAIPTTSISRAKLTAYTPNQDKLAIWTFLGTLSTISHGYVFILSAPIWVISGTIATSAQSYKPVVKYPPTDRNEFRKYARFPQGIPKGFNPQTLKPKTERH